MVAARKKRRKKERKKEGKKERKKKNNDFFVLRSTHSIAVGKKNERKKSTFGVCDEKSRRANATGDKEHVKSGECCKVNWSQRVVQTEISVPH